MQRLKIMMIGIMILAMASLAVPLKARAEMETYTIDKDHSFANWKIRHVVSHVSGTFSHISGKISLDPKDLSTINVEAVINIFSIDSSHRQRDVHLLSNEFLDGLKFKEMHFVSTGFKPTEEANVGILQGELTLHGVKRSVEFPFVLLGFGPDPWGGYRTGFEASTALKRSDFGIDWGLNLPGGGPVGDEVEVTLLIEGVKVAPEEAAPKIQ